MANHQHSTQKSAMMPGAEPLAPTQPEGRAEAFAGACVEEQLRHAEVLVLGGPDGRRNGTDHDLGQVAPHPEVVVAALGGEDGAGAVDELVAGVGLVDHARDVGLEVEGGTDVDLLAIGDQEEHEPAEQAAGSDDEQKGWALGAVDVPAHEADGSETEGGSAPAHQQCARGPRDGKGEGDDQARDAGCAAREGGDGEQDADQHEQAAVADVAAVVPAAAVGSAEGCGEAADVDDGDAPAGQADAADQRGADEQAFGGAIVHADGLGLGPAQPDADREAGDDERQDAEDIEGLHEAQLLEVEELFERVVLQQLEGHPRIKEGEHGPDEEERMEDVAAAVVGDDGAAERDEDHGEEHELKHELASREDGLRSPRRIDWKASAEGSQ